MFPVWLCDVWGVVHDGRRAFADAVDALTRHRKAGGCVVLITNAPRPASSVIPQMREFGVPDEAWDETVTSGDVTRELLNRWSGGNVHLIGPEEDNPLIEDLPMHFTGLAQADAVLVTGLRRDGRDGQPAEQPEDYRAELAAIARRGLPMVCANPDRVVGVGGRLYPAPAPLQTSMQHWAVKCTWPASPTARFTRWRWRVRARSLAVRSAMAMSWSSAMACPPTSKVAVPTGFRCISSPVAFTPPIMTASMHRPLPAGWKPAWPA